MLCFVLDWIDHGLSRAVGFAKIGYSEVVV